MSHEEVSWCIQAGSLIATALALLVAGCVHCLRDDQPGHWLLIMLALPLAGPVLYFLFVGVQPRRFMATSMAMAAPMTAAEARRARQRFEPRRSEGIVIPAETQQLALAAYVGGNFARAAELFEESLGPGAREWRLRYFQARALLELGRWREAIEALQDIIAAEGEGFDSGHAVYFLARAFEGHGDVERARMALDIAADTYRLAEAALALADLELAAGNEKRALELLAQVVQAARLAPPFQRRAARYWARRARRREAEIQSKPAV